MARPIKNSVDYFPHDADMRNHKKVKAIRSKFGVTGYAVWSLLLEYLSGSDGNVFPYSDLEFELMSGDFGVSATEIRGVVDYCISLEMLFVKDGFVHSESLDERLAPVYLKRGKAKELSEKQRRDNGKFVTNNTESTGVSVTEMPQIRLNEITLNETKLNVIAPKVASKTFEERKGDFWESLKAFWEKFGEQTVWDFYDYWTEKSPKGQKMRFEKEKVFDPARRLTTWKNNENNRKQYVRTATKGETRSTDAIIEPVKDFGIKQGFSRNNINGRGS